MEVVPGLHWVERIWDTKVYVLIEQDRVVLIDAATPGRAGAVWRHLELLGYPPEAVDEIWLTHGDIDHMGSAAALKERSGARLIAHQADVPLVEGSAEREMGPVAMAGAYRPLFHWAVRRVFRYQPAIVDRQVVEGDRLGDWEVVHVPGHTAGSICFFHPGRKIAVVGDAINYRRGRLGAPPPMFTPVPAQARSSIHKIAAMDIEVCCFGHGPPLREKAAQQIRVFAESFTQS